MHRTSAVGALVMACLSLVAVLVFVWGLIFTVPGFVTLANGALKGGREHGDGVTIAITVLAGAIALLALLAIAV